MPIILGKNDALLSEIFSVCYCSPASLSPAGHLYHPLWYIHIFLSVGSLYLALVFTSLKK